MPRAKTMPWWLLVVPVVCVIAVRSSPVATQGRANAGVTVYEGARLITGDGTAIESSAFIVENTQFTRVGRKGEVQAPAGAARVDLTGKTVMPTKVDMHGHIGFQHVYDGTMAKEYYTRENLIDHLERLAYFGISGVVSIADLIDRSDLHGGRTKWGDVPLRVRNEIIPGAALFKTAGPGIAWPESGRSGPPVQRRRALSGHDRRGGPRGDARLRQDEARVHQDLGRRQGRHQEETDRRRCSG